MNKPVSLGKPFRDQASGFEGIAIEYKLTLEGVEYYLIQPKSDGPGNFRPPQWISISRLVRIVKPSTDAK